MFRPNSLVRRLREMRPAFGVSHTFANSGMAEMLGLSGCDFVLLDAEHGLGDDGDQLRCLQALSATPASSLVRLASDDPIRIKRILDIGAEGIIFPNVSTAEQARAIVSACRYPPKGTRGYAAGGIRASNYGYALKDYLRDVEKELLIGVMIETGEGVGNAASIAAVEGVDVVQIGANDLSYDLGVPEQLAHPAMKEAIGVIETAARAAGKVLGGAPLPSIPLELMIERGYRLITIGRDSSLLASSLCARLAEMRAGLKD